MVRNIDKQWYLHCRTMKSSILLLFILTTRRLQLEQNYKNGDCETIYSNELQFKDLPTAGAQFNEIKDLKKSITKFIALYSQNNLAYNKNARVKILEQQKLVPGEQLAIADGISAGVETETPDLK